MIRILLSTVMVATQLLSWNASPRYLCHSEDGSVHVDLGPAACDCHEGEDAEIAPAVAAHSHDDHVCGPSPGAVHDPCGCTHIQLSEAQSATLQRATTVPDSHRLVIPLVLAGGADSAPCSLDTAGAAASPWHLPGSCSETLATLASVVIRC